LRSLRSVSPRSRRSVKRCSEYAFRLAAGPRVLLPRRRTSHCAACYSTSKEVARAASQVSTPSALCSVVCNTIWNTQLRDAKRVDGAWPCLSVELGLRTARASEDADALGGNCKFCRFREWRPHQLVEVEPTRASYICAGRRQTRSGRAGRQTRFLIPQIIMRVIRVLSVGVP
jgi:hypothetical protein